MANGITKAFNAMSDEFKLEMVQNVVLLKCTSFLEIRDELKETNFTDDIEKRYKAIKKHLLGYRNSYTHSMKKVSKPAYIDSASAIICKAEDAILLSSEGNKEKREFLLVRHGYNLDEALLKISVRCCRKDYFNKE